MISLEALLLLIIMFCVVFLTACMVVGIVFLFRCYSAFRRLEERVETLGKVINDNVFPVAKDFRETAMNVRDLSKTLGDAVSDYALLSMIKKVSPKLAGLKLGMDLGVKAYNSYLSTASGTDKKRRKGLLEILLNKN